MYNFDNFSEHNTRDVGTQKKKWQKHMPRFNNSRCYYYHLSWAIRRLIWWRILVSRSNGYIIHELGRRDVTCAQPEIGSEIDKHTHMIILPSLMQYGAQLSNTLPTVDQCHCIRTAIHNVSRDSYRRTYCFLCIIYYGFVDIVIRKSLCAGDFFYMFTTSNAHRKDPDCIHDLMFLLALRESNSRYEASKVL